MRAAQHGTRSKYVAGCSCDDCTKANRDYQREWMRADYRRNPQKYLDRQWRRSVGKS